MNDCNATPKKVTSHKSVKSVVPNWFLWIVNFILLLINSILLIGDIVIDIGRYGQIMPIAIHVLLLAFMIVKEFKVKSLGIRALLNVAVYAAYHLNVAFLYSAFR